MDTFNESRWKALPQHVWETGLDDASINILTDEHCEYITLYPTQNGTLPNNTNLNICETQLVWDTTWVPIIQCLAQQPGLLRREWWNRLYDLIVKWHAHGNWQQWYKHEWDTGELCESWQTWWVRLRQLNNTADISRAMWLIRTLVRNHPRLAILVYLDGNAQYTHRKVPEHTIWIKERWPFTDQTNNNFIKNLLQDLSGCPHSIPDEWINNVRSITWCLIELNDDPNWEIDVKYAWAQDLSERWLSGWNLSGWGCDKARFRAITFAWIDAWMHLPTHTWMATALHKPLSINSWWLSFIWQRWMTYKIPVADRLRFILAGGMVKSCWHLRDANDVDFLVLDHDETLENRYHPNLGSSKLKLFDDFGKTYYACEQYFFPTNPDWFAAQKSYTSDVRNTSRAICNDERTGSNLIPKFSASGLKASRFFPILQWMWDRFRHFDQDTDIPMLNSMDDLLMNPRWGFWRQGVHYVDLEWEFCRDHLKDLDLGWVSKKQVSDIEQWRSTYKIEDLRHLGWKKSQNGKYTPFLQWKWNIYHGNRINHPKTSEPVGFEVLIRRAPSCVHSVVKTIIDESQLTFMKSAWTQSYISGEPPEKPWRVESSSPGALILHHWDDSWEQTHGVEFCIVRQVLLCSLPSKIVYNTENGPVSASAIWWWVLTEKGELHVQLWTHCWNLGCGIVRLARGDRWVASGLGQIEESDKTSRWKFTLHRTEESCANWGTEGSETEIGCQNLSNFLTLLSQLFRLHKNYDVQQNKKWIVEFTTDKLFPDWERLPWIERSRAYWEKPPWIDRWIVIPQPNYSNMINMFQTTNGWEFTQNPTALVRKYLCQKKAKSCNK